MTPENQLIEVDIFINAPVSEVWTHLTTPELMKKWMLDTDMKVDIITDWKVGSPMLLKGKLHRMRFENKGKILKYQPEHVLQYSHLSSLSHLVDTPENYCYIQFALTPVNNQTELSFSITNFPTETIFKHLNFYWRSALSVMKSLIEGEIVPLKGFN